MDVDVKHIDAKCSCCKSTALKYHRVDVSDIEEIKYFWSCVDCNSEGMDIWSAVFQKTIYFHPDTHRFETKKKKEFVQEKL